MILSDLHTHPQIIKDDTKFDAFVKRALERGISRICITDHMPLLCSEASDRIPKGRVADYCKKSIRNALITISFSNKKRNKIVPFLLFY